MKVIGTAGHVDHGKSTLVAALTGIDPDRLKEEKAREMTIDLGFAWMTLPDGESIGFVDVPGHRDFIENMLAGVGGIDAVLFVIAADEGIMPQTREHLAILDLLAVKKGIIVLTKSDLVSDPTWMEMVVDDIQRAVKNTFLKNAAIIPVSSVTGVGLPELTEKLQEVLTDLPDKSDKENPRLSIDRVFSIQGFGTVVTGTLLDGKLTVGDEILILPSGKKGKIRGLQTHQKKLDVVSPGSRAAVNISGLEVKDILRGDLIAKIYASPSLRLDAYIQVLADANSPLRHNDEVKVFHLAAERMGRVRLLGADELLPGESGYIQIEFSKPIVVESFDRFIMRRPSPGETIGGGTVIQIAVKRRYKRLNSETIQKLMALHIGSYQEKLLEKLSSLPGFTLEEIRISNASIDYDLLQELNLLIENNHVLDLMPGVTRPEQKRFIARNQWDIFCNRLLKLVEDYHTQFPLRVGIQKDELKSKLKMNVQWIDLLIDQARVYSEIVDNNGFISLPTHTINYSPVHLDAINTLDSEFDRAPFSPPGRKQIIGIIGEELLKSLVFQKKLIRVSDDVIFRRQEFERMQSYVKSKILENGSLTVSDFRDAFSTSRKFALAFLEYMDKVGITLREGDIRIPGKLSKAPE
jgi:selenocysteine-specific elongation factor